MSLPALDILVFILLVPGLAAVLSPGGKRSAAERFCLGLVFALLTLYLSGFALYVANAPAAATWLLPTAMLAGAWLRRRHLRSLWSEPELRLLFGHWSIFALWTLGLLALIASFSGARWMGDCWEHHERALFFLNHLPKDTTLIGIYPLTSRPPLANIVTATLLELSGARYSDYQVHTALLATLFFFPAWLFFRSWGGAPPGLFTLLLMLSPLVAQNTTFGWTKLPTAFFVLAAAHFLVAGLRNPGDRTARFIAFLCLTCGLLTHYSAGPWLVVWALAYAAWGLRSGWSKFPLREAAMIAGTCALLASTWFGWAALTYGWRETGTANTTVASWNAQSAEQRFFTATENLVNTLIPHPLRAVDRADLQQRSSLGRLRDYWFNIYQVCLPLSVGFSGLAVFLWFVAAPRARRTRYSPDPADPARPFWWLTLPPVIVLGVTVHTTPDRWGLTHICLQPLVLLALAWVAATLRHLPARMVRVFSALLIVDVLLGILIHFLIQSMALTKWWAGTDNEREAAKSLNRIAANNHLYWSSADIRPLSHDLNLPPALIVAFLCAVLALVLAGLQSEKTAKVDSIPQA